MAWTHLVHNGVQLDALVTIETTFHSVKVEFFLEQLVNQQLVSDNSVRWSQLSSRGTKN